MKELDLREEIFNELLESDPEGLYESIFKDMASLFSRNRDLVKVFFKTPWDQWEEKFRDLFSEHFNPNEFEKTFDCYDQEFRKIIERRQIAIINKIKRKFLKVKKGEELTLVSTIMKHSDTLKELQRYYNLSTSILSHLMESRISGARGAFGEHFNAYMDRKRPSLKLIINDTEEK